jgi:Tol biopolymer transport system component
MKQRWIGLALSVALLAACEGGGSAEPPSSSPSGPAEAHDPTPTPTPAELGIFADVRGWIAYGNNEGIWAVNPTGGTPADRVQLSERGPAVPLAWSSDGSKLLINRGDPSYLGPDELVVLNSDGTESLLVRGGRYDSFSGGSFTPDGSKIVYATLTWPPNEDWHSGIYVVDADGGSPGLLFAGGQRDYPDGSFHTAVFSATFSPDGTQIAYVDGMGDWGNTLRVMNADGSGVRVLFDEGFSHFDNLAWAADGSRLAFNGTGGGIWIVGLDGSGLTKVDGKDVRWSPTGSGIAFRAGSPSSAGLWVGEGIWVMNGDGSGRRQVVPRGREPIWSPDGSRIAYLGHAGLLYVADRDGSHVRMLGNLSPPRPTSVAWNPVPPPAS